MQHKFDWIVYPGLGLILFIALTIINRKPKVKDTVTNDPGERNEVPPGLEHLEDLNKVVFLLHDMVKAYNVRNEKQDAADYLNKILVGKTWPERLEKLPIKNTDKGNDTDDNQ